MAARRLLIVMLVLLGISTLAAALAPTERRGTSATTTTIEETTIEDTLPSGRLFERSIKVGGRTLPVVPLTLGSQLILTVRAKARYDVSIPRLGLVDAVDPESPAMFDILPLEPGGYKIQLVEPRRNVTVGWIKVTRPAKKSAKAPKSRAPAEPASG